MADGPPPPQPCSSSSSSPLLRQSPPNRLAPSLLKKEKGISPEARSTSTVVHGRELERHQGFIQPLDPGYNQTLDLVKGLSSESGIVLVEKLHHLQLICLVFQGIIVRTIINGMDTLV
ncbi:hypothetical protein AKJ16_DCAP13306 [Drosera capensis]